MKHFYIIISALLLGSLQLCASDDLEEGKRLYNETCVSCHGETGATDTGIKLTVKPRRLKDSILSAQQMVKIISDGGHAYGAHSDIMSAFKYVYEEEQIENIAQYVSKTFNAHREARIKKHLSEAKVEKLDAKKMHKIGKKIFKRNCSLCHGLKGDGNSIYVEQSKENKEFLFPYDLRKTVLDEDQIFLILKFGAHYWGADKKDMPSWSRKYDDTKLRAVAHFVKTKIVGTD